jgi:hypothetical protein
MSAKLGVSGVMRGHTQGIRTELKNGYWKGSTMLARVTAEQGRRYMRAAGRVFTCTLKHALLGR